MELLMEESILAITAQASVLAVSGAGLMPVDSFTDLNGRSNRSYWVRRFAIRLLQFQIALKIPSFDDGWFVDQFCFPGWDSRRSPCQWMIAVQ